MKIRIKIDYAKMTPDVAQYCINEIYGVKCECYWYEHDEDYFFLCIDTDYTDVFDVICKNYGHWGEIYY